MSESERFLEAIESAKASGKLKKGVNEVTKALERGVAKLVVYAGDVSPKEIVMHLPILAKEKNVPCGEVASKEELAAAAGLPRPTSAVAILDIGKAKDVLKELQNEAAEEAAEEVAEEAPAEEATEESNEEDKKEE
ncbi:ribosomal L7Ae/L30e/S12e/Gadd45 family protein [Candidatus Woesearchaeota archaeon]|nr:ribosomal L7Ae/L30e/S12e/Gadd45 family protein [Candidatus Woesearchaeota archaeon]